MQGRTGAGAKSQPFSRLQEFTLHRSHCFALSPSTCPPFSVTDRLFPSSLLFYLENEAADSSETLVIFYQTTRRHIPEDDNLHTFYIDHPFSSEFIKPISDRSACLLHLAVCFTWLIFTLKIAVVCSSETSVKYRTMRSHILLHRHRRENLKTPEAQRKPIIIQWFT
jgi:hypothetical protein